MLNGDLSVRVNDGHTDRLVTRRTSGLRFTKTAPGGHQSCSFHLDVPRNTFTDLGPADRCWIYDGRSGKTVFGAAYTENPTPVDGPDGQSYDITAYGGMARANDETRALIYVDQTLDSWQKDPFAMTAANVESGIWPGNGISKQLLLSVPGGGVAATGAFSGADIRALQTAGMHLGALTVYVQSGKTDAGWKVTLDHPAGSIVLTSGMTPIGAGFYLYAGTDFPSPTDYVSLRLVRIGAPTNVADDATWTEFVNLIVNGQRVDRNGTILVGSSGMGPAGSVLASQVVEDLLGRLLTFCDPGTAQIDTSAFAIDQLTYPNGAKAAGVLDDLGLFEPDILWEVLETLDNGLHRFNYRGWPTEPRYVVSIKDGWQQTGGDVDLCNRVWVNWNDADGNAVNVPITAASLGLVGLGYPVDALGSRIKDADPISLPDGKGSWANANRIAALVLADKVNPPLAGAVVVRRPILDLLTGNRVMPWELEPGYLCRVRELGQDLRTTQMAYDDGPVAASLTLGRPVLTVEQRLARLVAA